MESRGWAVGLRFVSQMMTVTRYRREKLTARYDKLFLRTTLLSLLHSIGVTNGFLFCVLKNYDENHNYNKILKSEWLSTVLISALTGQCNRTVSVMAW